MEVTVDSPNDKNKEFEDKTTEDSQLKPPEKKQQEKDEEINYLLTDSGIGALAKSASASSKKVKVFWVLLFLSALIGFTTNLYQIIYRFFRKPVLTQMDQEFGEFTWPHITICNPSNPIAFWKNPALEMKWNEFLKKSGKLPKMLYRGGKDVTIFDQYYLMSTVNPGEFFKNSAQAAFLSVQVLAKQNDIATSSGDFDRYTSVRNFTFAIDERLGSSRYPVPCLTLKPEELIKISKLKDPAALLGIKFTLILDFKSYKIFNSGFENRKLYLFLSKPYQTLKSSTLYFIYPGTDSSFFTSEIHYKRIRGCNDHDFQVDMYDTTMTRTRKYSGGFESCREFVSQMLFQQKCKCYNPFLPIFKVSDTLPRLCLNISLYNSQQLKENLDCLNNVKEKYTNGKEFKKVVDRECEKYTKPLCSQITYNYVRNTNNWQLEMSDNRRNLLRGAISNLPNKPKEVTDNFANLNMATVKIVRAPGMVVATLEEYEYPASQLLSDIGGTMGLWLGISVISLFEILQFFILLTHLLLRRRKLIK